MIAKVKSLHDLRSRAHDGPRYAKLLVIAAANLGGDIDVNRTDSDERIKAMQWLNVNANETSEAGVIAEVNFCRDLVG